MYAVQSLYAGTGIFLIAGDGSRVPARTSHITSDQKDIGLVIVPRGAELSSSDEGGLEYDSIYGYVGIYEGQESCVVEGVNETGLSAGAFDYNISCINTEMISERRSRTLSDKDVVSWILSQFSSIEQIKDEIRSVDVVASNTDFISVHWRIADSEGNSAVIEFVNGSPCFYDDVRGVITDAPDYQWQLANLETYLDELSGKGSGILQNLPGDNSSSSRFIRAFCLQTSTAVPETGMDAVVSAFRILDSFYDPASVSEQFTCASDLKSMKFYYKTSFDCSLRCVDLMKIDFHKVRHKSRPLDISQGQQIEYVRLR